MKLEAKTRLLLTALASGEVVKLSPHTAQQLAQAYVTESNRLLKIVQYLCYEMDVGEPEQQLMDGKAVRALALSMVYHGASRWWMTLHAPLLNTIGLNEEQTKHVQQRLEPALKSGQRRLFELFDQATKHIHADLWDSADNVGATIGFHPTDENLELIHENEAPILEDSKLPTDQFEFNQMGGLTSASLQAKSRLRSTE